jgi:hypothetical protein
MTAAGGGGGAAGSFAADTRTGARRRSAPGPAWRRAAAAPVVTWRRARARPGRTLLVALGVAVAVAFLIGAAGGSMLSEELALRHALTALPPAERVVRVSWSGQVNTGGYAPLDRRARGALRALTGAPVDSSLELANVRLGTGLVKLGATNTLGGAVHLISGRLPRSCGDARCEVVQIAGRRVGRIDDFGVHLVVVGRGTLTSLVPFGEGGLATESTAGGQRPEPVLLTSSVPGLAGLTPLVQLNRNYSWSAPLTAGGVHSWTVDRLFRTEGQVQGALSAADGHFSLTGPDDELAQAQTESQTASHRVLLVGGSAAVLLLAFAGITAGALRRDTRAELRRLALRGATRGQQHAFVISEAVAAVLPGTIAGVLLAALADGLIANRVHVGIGAALRHGLATPTAVLLGLLGALAAVVAVVLSLTAPESRQARGVRPIDMAAIGAVVALVLLLARGSGDSASLGSGPAVALAATPLLASFAFCVLVGRLLEPGIRVALRGARSGPTTLLLALLTLQRSPGRTAGIVGFLAVSAGLAMFALSYRSTLAASSSERAAYQVPLDYSLTVGPSLVQPRDVATLAGYRALAPGVGAFPILRQAAEVPGRGSRPATPTVLGVPADALPLLHGWRGDFSARTPAELARLLRPSGSVALAGANIPATARTLTLPVRLDGAAVQPVLVVLTPSGDADQLLGPALTAGTHVARFAVPAADRGGRIVALQLQLPSAVQRSSAHQQAEHANTGSAFAGSLRFGPLTAVQTVVTSFGGWDGLGGITRDGRRLDYSLTTAETAMLRPRQPFDSRPLPVVASPDVAAAAGPGGALELNFGDQVVEARLVAVAHRFPTTEDANESFVVADESSLAAAIGANDLPTAIPDELWLSAPPAVAARVGEELARPPFATLQTSSRAAIATGLRQQPLARGIVVSLLTAALAAVALALVGLALVTAGFVRDDGDTLFDLETQGVGPRALRATVRWRALGVAALGLAAGIILGAVMVAVTERLLALDATLTVPDPPLRRVIPWLTIGGSVLLFAVAAWGLIELVLRVAQRSSAAGRGFTGEGWAA